MENIFMSQKDVGNKIPIYKLKTTEEVMKYYDEWGEENKYNKDMFEWNYTGPKETVNTFKKYSLNKESTIFDAGCGTGLVGLELKKFGYKNFHGADLSQTLLDLVPEGLYNSLKKVDLNQKINYEDNSLASEEAEVVYKISKEQFAEIESSTMFQSLFIEDQEVDYFFNMHVANQIVDE